MEIFKEDYTIELDNHTICAYTKNQLMIKISQIASGHLYTKENNKDITIHINDLKFKALEHMLSTITTPVLVLYTYVTDKEKLLQENNFVICLDNFFTGSKKNIEHLLDNKNFQLVEHDVTIPYDIEVDEIYNLAAQSQVQVSFDVPEYSGDVDALGVLRILEAVRILGLTKKTKIFHI